MTKTLQRPNPATEVETYKGRAVVLETSGNGSHAVIELVENNRPGWRTITEIDRPEGGWVPVLARCIDCGRDTYGRTWDRDAGWTGGCLNACKT